MASKMFKEELRVRTEKLAKSLYEIAYPGRAFEDAEDNLQTNYRLDAVDYMAENSHMMPPPEVFADYEPEPTYTETGTLAYGMPTWEWFKAKWMSQHFSGPSEMIDHEAAFEAFVAAHPRTCIRR